MGLSRQLIVVATIFAVFLCMCIEDADGRRVILKGRKTVTRTYFYDSVLPAWLVVLLSALGEVVFGVILYFILKKVIIDPPVAGYYSVERSGSKTFRS